MPSDYQQSLETKKLIFCNILNRVAIEDICKNFNVTDKEVEDAFKFITARIQSHWYDLRQTDQFIPAIKCANYAEARVNRIQLLEIVEKIDLSVLKYKVTTTENLGIIAK